MAKARLRGSDVLPQFAAALAVERLANSTWGLFGGFGGFSLGL